MKKPSKAKVNALVKAYAVQRQAKWQDAPLRVQQRLYDEFWDLLMSLFREHEDYLGKYPHPEFYRGLEQAANKFDKSRMMSGAGVDW